MTSSLCEACALMREVVTPKGSRFLLCQLSAVRANRTSTRRPRNSMWMRFICEGNFSVSILFMLASSSTGGR